MSEGIRCMWMRGGTSKGGYFLAEDLPQNQEQRDAFLLRVMGSPDDRQIDGMGGAHPLTSKVGVVKASQRDDIDVDYLFLQVVVDEPVVTDAQNCGNILAGVGQFAIERGLVEAEPDTTDVRIFMVNTGQVAIATIQTPGGVVTYDGDARIDGVPGTSAPVLITFQDTAGASCGALLPSGNASDIIEGTRVTMIDNGMPTVILRAADFGLDGSESREDLDNDSELKAKLEGIRLQAGYLMNLGDVSGKTVPKMTLVSEPKADGAIDTRTFIPHRLHASIGVLGAVSVATACAIKGSIAHQLAVMTGNEVGIEHPTGMTNVVLSRDANGDVVSAAMLRTARKLMDGVVFG
ncbi:4-oxalomesaconate tautomerase [Reinekea blandensis]|uniref:FldA protein n=1 Tax=Reinekea blandensis MED297 TaxID=314283 RepID=A4BGX4_9GAMM|nr:4-oxalomesaconate tautomerase [Reinekea blandensis]EAR08620.1 FldA protein [Reinekea sp. MED297] [Reinekea blandensis MED297]